jgi:hypothetical protein
MSADLQHLHHETLTIFKIYLDAKRELNNVH